MSSFQSVPTIARRGFILVLSSPSGAGKTTLTRRLLEEDPGFVPSVSTTTRPPRPGEVEGQDYNFVARERFEKLVEAGAFLEHAKVFDHRYGTPQAPVDAALEAGKDILFDIDWQGTQQVRANAGAKLVSVFILPPSLAELERRLTTRAQDPPEVVRRRMAKAADEMSHWAEYDYVIVNEVVEESLAKLRAIVTAERLKRERQVGLVPFVNSLRGGD
ncbi:MAG: guanylate kinase [Rhodospirillales bacterium]